MMIRCVRRMSSALYITGNRASENFAVLTPLIDFDGSTDTKDKMLLNLQQRRIRFNYDELEQKWQFFQDVKYRKELLELTRSEIGQLIGRLMKEEPGNAEVDRLKLQIKVIKDDLRMLKHTLYGVEESVMLQLLDLPNSLHPLTPLQSPTEVHSHKTPATPRTRNPQVINNCYLTKEGALFEHALQGYFQRQLLDSDFLQLSNPDFVKSVVIEGCGGQFEEVLTLEEQTVGVNRLHLVGGSSLYSFMAHCTKHFVQKGQLPLKWFSIGRKYDNVLHSQSLYNLSQTSQVGLFMASTMEQQLLDSIILLLTSLYRQLDYHFKILLIPAFQLQKVESLRVSVQMFSNSLQSYVEVAHVSVYGNYLSKRLLFNYNEGKERRYLSVYGGSVGNLHRILRCVMEADNGPLVGDMLMEYC